MVVMGVGLVLGFLPHEGRGFFQSSATGFPHAEVAMLLVTGALFYVGLARGAYPTVSARFPRLLGPWTPKAPAQSR